MTDLDPGYFNEPLSAVDPEIADALQHELERQQGTLEMIASENFVPRAILEYSLNDDKSMNLFASYSEGTRPGAVNTGFLSLPAYAQAQVAAQFSVPATVPEEKLHNYELGLKGDFFDHTLRILSDVYYAQDRGAQVAAALFYTNLQGVLAQANVTVGTGATNAWGTEWEFTWAPTEHLNFLAPEGVSTESEASAADVAKLVDQVKHDKASAIFVENITDKRLIDQIASETGLKVGGTLYSDALSTADGPAATYIDMINHNIETITAAVLSQ